MRSTGENPAYLTDQIITYLGNKRSLLPFIGRALNIVKRSVGKRRLDAFDVFSGSGIVARYFKRHCRTMYVNDLEDYSQLVNSCYLSNRSGIDMPFLEKCHGEIVRRAEEESRPGIVTELYSPADDSDIKPGERVFYTRENALYIDTVRSLVDEFPEDMRKFLLAPLLYKASVNNNTGGVFKGFYKNRSGVGQFGGQGKNALNRILGRIRLPFPVFSNFDCDCVITGKDAIEAAGEAEEVDIAYLDPPYNQHPYGSNYFMLNLILRNEHPGEVSAVSGIPREWKRSRYNVREFAMNELFRLVDEIKAKFVLISYNSEGFVKYGDFVEYLSKKGKLRVFSTKYNAFRACRNLNMRDIHVKEYLFLLEK